MPPDARIAAQFDDLLADGASILESMSWDGSRYYRGPRDEDFQSFRIRALNLIRRVCGDDSDHYRQLLGQGKNAEVYAANGYVFMPHGVGIVRAAKLDYEAGMLFDLQRLIEAEVFDDFLEQAEHLHAAGYITAAASLAGAVLEDSLRKLSDANGIPVPTKTRIDTLNAELAKKGVYSKLQQKRVTALADIRNSADHGHSDQFETSDVARMVAEVRELVTKHLQ